MALIIIDQTFLKTQMTEKELLVELACYLYDKKKLSMGRAKALARLHQIAFQKALAIRNIDLHYSEADLNKDLENLGIKL
ncbi:MAG: UPF0175 family protein [Chitinophagales bacterium]